jgi:hypothetical protein
MNIRIRVIETSVDGYYHTAKIRTEGSIFSRPHWEERKIYIPGRYEEKEILEYLNPTTAKWEPLPKVFATVDIQAPKNT